VIESKQAATPQRHAGLNRLPLWAEQKFFKKDKNGELS
jgi:hypothetical protein